MVQSSYALGLPSTSTPSSSVAGHKRSPIHRHSARQKKRQRVVMEESSSNSNDSIGIGSMSKTEDASTSQQSSSTSLAGLISGLMRALRFSNPHDIQPTPSSSSSKQASSRPESRVRDWNDMSTAYEGTSTVADITREPEDDTMFLSPPALSSGLPSSSTLTSLMPSESDTQQQRRHGHVPMFQDEVAKFRSSSFGRQLTRPLTPISSSGHPQAQMRARQRRERQKQALGLLNPHLARRNRDPVNESVTSGDTSSLGLSSHTYSETTSPPNSRYAGSDRTLQNRHTVAYSSPNVGLSFDAYSKLVEQKQFGPKRNILSVLAAPYKTDDRDVLLQRRMAPQAEQASLERSLEIAKSSLGTPKPKTPKWTAYRRSKLRDEKLSEDIDDMTRRRRIWPDSIPPENEKIIKAVLRTPGVISTLPAAEVSQKDIVKLLPGEWLNDEIINFYGVMVNLRSAAAKARRDKGFSEPGDENLLDVHVFSSFFFEKVSKQGYNSVRRWTKKFDLFKKDIVIMPVNLGNAHWVCAAINIEKQRFEYYDSMGKINFNVLEELREYVKAEHLDKKKTEIDLSDWVDYHNPKTPQQANGYDCGVFTSQFIECLSRRDGHFDFDQKNMPYLRKKMIHEIKMMQFSPEQWFDPNA